MENKFKKRQKILKDSPIKSSPSFSNDDSKYCPFCDHPEFKNESLRDEHIKLCRPDWAIEVSTKKNLKEKEEKEHNEQTSDSSELGEMQKKYPFLYLWKKKGGLKKDLSFPKEKLIEIMGKAGFSRVYGFGERRVSPPIEIMNSTKEKEWIESIYESRALILYGENRQKVGKELINKLLPKSQGGRKLSTNQAIILKNVHKELLGLIKKINVKFRGVACKNLGKEIEKKFPNISDILDEEEVLTLEENLFPDDRYPQVKELPPKKTSLSIIEKRVKVSQGTLENIFNGITLPSYRKQQK